MAPTTYPIPAKLDVGDIRAVFDLWLSFQASRMNARSDLQREAILMTWAHYGPDAFREALLASIANGWKNLVPPSHNPGIAQPRASQKPEATRHTLGIKDPGKGKVFLLRGTNPTALQFKGDKK